MECEGVKSVESLGAYSGTAGVTYHQQYYQQYYTSGFPSDHCRSGQGQRKKLQVRYGSALTLHLNETQCASIHVPSLRIIPQVPTPAPTKATVPTPAPTTVALADFWHEDLLKLGEILSTAKQQLDNAVEVAQHQAPGTEGHSAPEGVKEPGHQAPFKAECACARELGPVCGTDGEAYGNACAAGCAGAGIAAHGPCPTGKAEVVHDGFQRIDTASRADLSVSTVGKADMQPQATRASRAHGS